MAFPEVRVFKHFLLLLMLISPHKFFLANAAECEAFRGAQAWPPAGTRRCGCELRLGSPGPRFLQAGCLHTGEQYFCLDISSF